MIEVDTSGLFTPGFGELRHGEFIPFQNPLRLELEPYGYRFYQIVPVG